LAAWGGAAAPSMRDSRLILNIGRLPEDNREDRVHARGWPVWL